MTYAAIMTKAIARENKVLDGVIMSVMPISLRKALQVEKTFKNCYLYIFSNGQVQVGQPKFNQIVISRAGERWFGEIKEKEGVW